MTADPPTPPAVLEERARSIQVIDSAITRAQSWIAEFGEDSEIAAWSWLAELDQIRSQIDDSIPPNE